MRAGQHRRPGQGFRTDPHGTGRISTSLTPLTATLGRPVERSITGHDLHPERCEQFYNSHRPHQGIANDRPLHALPQPITDQALITDVDIRQHQRMGGILNEYHHAA